MWILMKRTSRAALVCIAVLEVSVSQARGQMMGSMGARPAAQQGVLGVTRGGFTFPGGVGLLGGGVGLYGGGLGLYGGGVGLYGGGLGLYGGGVGLYGGGVAPATYGSAYGVSGAAGAYGAAGGSAYGSYYESSYGGYLRGNADVIGATGRFLVNEQDARRTYEQVRQARIETRRKAFDQYLYERDHTPTLEDERERLRALEVRRSLNDPPVTEIWSAKALNDLLGDVQKLQVKGVSGPQVTLDADMLKRINVAAGRRPGNVALLKNQGRLAWPAALLSAKLPREAEDRRQQISSLLPEAINQAINGKVDAHLLKELRHALGGLRALLIGSVGRCPPNQYIEARHFLNDLDDGLTVLAQPDAGLYFTDKYTAKGRSVPDLIEYMTQKGLAFAPAVAGDEAAYAALYRALAAYDVAARAQTGSEREGSKEK
jgi:hypothetical protein